MLHYHMITRHLSKVYPTTDTHSKKVFFSCNDALAATVASLFAPHGRAHCGNVNPAFRSGVCRTSCTDCVDSHVEHGLEALLREGGTFQVLDGSNIFSHRHALRVLDWCHVPKHQSRRAHASVRQSSTNDTSDERAICHLSLSFSIIPWSSRGSSFVPTSTTVVEGA